MKQLIALIIIPLIIFWSCNSSTLSEEQKKNLGAMIFLHNSQVKMRFFDDSINAASRIEIEYLGYPKEEVKEYIKTHMRVFENEWNKPYDIRRDRFLTLEKYLEYCKTHNIDPKTFYKELI